MNSLNVFHVSPIPSSVSSPSQYSHLESSSSGLCNARVSIPLLAVRGQAGCRKLSIFYLRHLALHLVLDAHHLCWPACRYTYVCPAGEDQIWEYEIKVSMEDCMFSERRICAGSGAGSASSRHRHRVLVCRPCPLINQDMLMVSSLGAVYNAGYFRMSTWIPFTWALVCSLILILSSFTVGGGL